MLVTASRIHMAPLVRMIAVMRDENEKDEIENARIENLHAEFATVMTFRVFQIPPTRPSTRPSTRPQLKPRFDQVGVQVGVIYLNAIYFSPIHTSTSPAVTIYGSRFLGHRSSWRSPLYHHYQPPNVLLVVPNDNIDHHAADSCIISVWDSTATSNTRFVNNDKGWARYVSFISFFLLY